MADKDYAYNDPDAPKTLIPQALTAYRHFAVREEDRQLFPMNQYGYVNSSPMAALLGADISCYRIQGVHKYNPEYYLDDETVTFDRWRPRNPLSGMSAVTPGLFGCTCALCRDIEYRQRGKPQGDRLRPNPPRPVSEDTQDRSAEVFAAECGRSPQSKMKFSFFFPGTAKKDHHEAPGDGCSCGFYAHYEPDSDFYDGTVWYPGETMTLVRAVVEMSGRVVLGTKGVRAEKMKLLAMSVDYAKMAQRKRPDPYEEVMTLSGWRAFPESRDYTYEEKRSIRARSGIAVENTARLYGARFYDDPWVMYKDYPKPNIDHLFPKEGPGEQAE